MKVFLKRIGAIILIAYLVVLAGVYLFQDRLIFQRKPLPVDYSYTHTFTQTFEEFFIPTPDHNLLNALLFRSTYPSKGLIIYFHGNAGNLARWGKYSTDFTKLGYDILMFDYRGYGKSTGTPSAQNLYSDASTVLTWANKNIAFSELILYGRSLGSAVATHLAAQVQPHLLILETPFDEIKNIVYWPLKPIVYLLPLRQNLSNKEAIGKVKCKIIIFHGTADWIVPLSSAIQLKPYLADPNDFIIIEGAGHKNLSDFKAYHTNLKRILH